MSARSSKALRRNIRKEAIKQSDKIVNAFLDEAGAWPLSARVRFAFRFVKGSRKRREVKP